MKVAIIGTRGIPNNHGGFEQFAEYFSVYLVNQGQDVYVYNSSTHHHKEITYKRVNIIHCYDPEDKIGTAGQFVYDLNCILDSRKRNFDIILQLGYTSSAIWQWLLPASAVVITNMDGLEWKRSKYSKPVQLFLKYSEKLAIRNSNYLISDSLGIQQYLLEKHSVKSTFIPYGAKLFNNPEESILDTFKLKPYQYNMLIARLEPENNIETILMGACNSNKKTTFLVIGRNDNKYGEYLKKKFEKFSFIRFIGGLYDLEQLNNLRYFSNLYFHGHSVGGTNPSLLEAMASQAFIVANNNIFNSAILGEDALYFNDSNDVSKIIGTVQRSKKNTMIENNLLKVKTNYCWEIINNSYFHLMKKVLNTK
jgi:hypothetical protein